MARIEALEAEAEEAEARAASTRARAQAVRQRQELEESSQGDPDAPAGALAKAADPAAGGEALDIEDDAVLDADDDVTTLRRRLVRRPRVRTVVTAAACLVFVVLFAASGFMAWRYHAAAQDRERAAQFSAVARQGVVNMTTLDFTTPERDVARVLDGATGEFHDDFARRVDDFISVVRDSKVVTKGTVKSTAVESMTDSSAVVLVAATSTVTNAVGAKDEPRNWRLSVTVTRDGDQLKMSKVEFIP